MAQLSSYAQALSYRTKTPLKHIRCAYFDENGYYEFSPKNLPKSPHPAKIAEILKT